jgi:translation elongation factor EF-Ts
VHDPDFRASFEDFSTFTEKVTEKVVEADETIPELPVKDVVSSLASSSLDMIANVSDLSHLSRRAQSQAEAPT